MFENIRKDKEMPPKINRSLSVSKQCEDCGSPNPVACKSCTACGADFYSSSLDKSDSPEAGSDASNTPSSARRSRGGGGKKPDYYDALEFDTKRKRPGLGPSTPTRTGKRFAGMGDKIPYKSPRTPKHHEGGRQEGTPQRGRPRKGTMLDVRDKKRQKKKLIKELAELERKESSRESLQDPEEEMSTYMDDLPPEKCLKLKVSLAEMNRVLGVVMFQPR